MNTQPPKQRGTAQTSSRVFVGNLPFDTSEDDVKGLFAECGRVLFVRFALDADENPRGFCHVIFQVLGCLVG